MVLSHLLVGDAMAVPLQWIGEGATTLAMRAMRFFRAGAHRCARGLVIQHLIGIEIPCSAIEIERLDQPLLSNLSN